MIKIEIEFDRESAAGGFTLRIADRYDYGLSFDELLGRVAMAVVHIVDTGEVGKCGLRTTEEHKAFENFLKGVDARRDAEKLSDPLANQE